MKKLVVGIMLAAFVSASASAVPNMPRVGMYSCLVKAGPGFTDMYWMGDPLNAMI